MRKSMIVGLGMSLCCSVSFAQDAPKKLNATDLSVQTHKWDGKSIQTTVACFYADAEDYRCAVGGLGAADTLVRIDVTKIDPPEMKKVVEDNCDTIEKMKTRACRFVITFTYAANDRQEKADGTIVMMILTEGNTAFFARAK